MINIGIRFEYLEGQKFGRLTVLEYVKNSKYLCRCDCGNEKIIMGHDMKKGKTKSCGCLNKSRELDIVGKKFNMLTVLERVGKTDDNQYLFRCLCDCGEEKVAKGKEVKRGKTMSCGNHNAEKVSEANTTHGKSKERIYGIHRNMKRRCLNSGVKQYKDYGGRGIKVCDEWSTKGGFERFYSWAMDNGYSDDLSIDRINVNGNYEPENCRWISMAEQQLNTRVNIYFELNGIRKPLALWCKDLELKYDPVWKRIHKYGWSFEDAVTKNIHKVKLIN